MLYEYRQGSLASYCIAIMEMLYRGVLLRWDIYASVIKKVKQKFDTKVSE